MEVEAFQTRKLLEKSLEAEALISGIRNAHNAITHSEMLEAKGETIDIEDIKKTMKGLEKKLYVLINEISLLQKQLEKDSNTKAEEIGLQMEEKENAFSA